MHLAKSSSVQYLFAGMKQLWKKGFSVLIKWQMNSQKLLNIDFLKEHEVKGITGALDCLIIFNLKGKIC